MRFQALPLAGAWLVEQEPIEDERGLFARTWCQREFEAHGITARLVQCNRSFNPHRGTIRGMHYQLAPNEEAKLIRCTHGAIHDIILDLRSSSPTYGEWFSIELSQGNQSSLYIPEGFAHGFQTLADHSEVYYQMSEFFHPESARGIRWDDPAFNFSWPLPCTVISKKDCDYPDFLTVRR